MGQSAEQKLTGVLGLTASPLSPVYSAASWEEKIRALKQEIKQLKQEALERNRVIGKLNNQIQRYYDVIGAQREDY